MTKTLHEPAFHKLTQEVKGILSSAQSASSEEKTAGYWNVGARISRERLSQEAGYERAVLKEVADAIGVSARTLQHAVVLHAAYDAPPPGPLTWAHYRLLAPLSTKKERTFYSKKAIAGDWSVRDLAAAIHADLFGGGSPGDSPLERPTLPTYVYGAKSPRLVDADTFDLDIDLGFHTWTQKRIRLARIDCPSGTTSARRSGR